MSASRSPAPMIAALAAVACGIPGRKGGHPQRLSSSRRSGLTLHRRTNLLFRGAHQCGRVLGQVSLMVSPGSAFRDGLVSARKWTRTRDASVEGRAEA